MLLPFSCFNAVRCVTYQIVEMTVNVLVVVKSRKYSQSIKLCFSPPIDELMNLVFFIELNVLIGSQVHKLCNRDTWPICCIC